MLFSAVFQVVCVVHNFKGKLLLSEDPQQESMSSAPMMSMPRVESPLEKYIASQVEHSRIYIVLPTVILCIAWNVTLYDYWCDIKT